MWSTTPSIVKKLQPTMPPFAKRLATVSLYHNKVSTKSARNGSKSLQFVGAIGVHWLVPVLLLLNFSSGERRLMTWSHSNRFYKKAISSHCLDLQKELKLSTLYSGHFGPKDLSITQDVAGHVIHLNAIFKMKLGYFLVNYLSWDILKIIYIRPPPLDFWETRKEPGLNLLKDEMAT